MAPSQTTRTTTLRVPTDLRDEISRLAEHRGTTMVDVVADAVHRLGRDEWWAATRSALDSLSEADMASYQTESRRLSAASVDGLDG